MGRDRSFWGFVVISMLVKWPGERRDLSIDGSQSTMGARSRHPGCKRGILQ
jgi:hypothetical protein